MTQRIRELSYDAYLHPRWWPTWAAVGSLWLVSQLPIPTLQAVGKKLGSVTYVLAGRRRHITEVNIRLCFPELNADEQAALVKKSFQSNAMGLLESTAAWFKDREEFRRITRVHGLENIHDALKNNHGVLLLGGHFSIMDLAGMLVSDSISFDVMQRDHNNKLFNAVITRSRGTYSGIAISRKDIRGLIRRLKMNRVVWYAPDQDFGKKNAVFATFFGIPTATVTSTARIAKSTGAAIIPVSFFRREDAQGYDVYFAPALTDFPSGDDFVDAQRTNSILETQIRRYPDQYLWMHRRFKSRPDGESNLYQAHK